MAPSRPNDIKQRDLADAVRALAMDAVEKAQGMADVATVLFQRFLKFDPAHPHWPDRDRFVLSAGHGSMLLYAVLYLTGYPEMTIDELKRFRQLGSRTAGHPEHGHAPGIETTTGPLGQGLSNSVGMALAERLLATEFGDKLVNHRTYVIASDGDLMEGLSHCCSTTIGSRLMDRSRSPIPSIRCAGSNPQAGAPTESMGTIRTPLRARSRTRTLRRNLP